MPKSMVNLAEKRRKQEYPPRTFSRLVQDLIAEDLRQAGMLPQHKNGEMADAA
jgi:hypothetical protein